MNPLILAIAGVMFILVLVLVAALLADERRLRVQDRVAGLQQTRSPLLEELALPFHQRVLGPMFQRFAARIGSMAPAEALENAQI